MDSPVSLAGRPPREDIYVQWFLTVFDVSLKPDELTIQSEISTGRATASCRVPQPDATDSANARRLSRGESVTCKGVIKGPGMFGVIEIDPAIVLW